MPEVTHILIGVMDKTPLRICRFGSGEMTEQVRTRAAFPEDPGSIPSTHMEAGYYL